jgi:DHA3 family macrolide efflux protein-like MFS transporter
MEQISTKETFRSYLIFWIGQLFSLLGSSVVQFVVIWWINVETGSPVYLSIAAFFSTIPMVILMPVVGVFIDRWNRKLTIAIADFLQALITLWLIILFISDNAEIWPVILINGLRGVCQAFHFPTVNAIIPIMIPKDKLSRMNGINYLFTGLINAFGPQIGANLLAFFSISEIMWIDIITFLIAITPLILIKIPSISKRECITQPKSYYKDLKQGLKIIKIVPGLLTLFILISAINFLNMPFNTLMPYYVKFIHFGNEIAYAFVSTLAQLGIVAGALLASAKKSWKRKELVILRGILFGFFGYFLTTIAPLGNFFIIGIGNLIHASMVPIINTMFLTILQTKVPMKTQGRVFSIVASIAFGITPIGMIISGPLAEIFGIYFLFYSSLIIQMISLLVVWIFSSIRCLTNRKDFVEIIE